MECPYCGSENVSYEGIDDGMGPFGDCIGDVWLCHDCNLEFEGEMISYNELEAEAEEDGEA